RLPDGSLDPVRLVPPALGPVARPVVGVGGVAGAVVPPAVLAFAADPVGPAPADDPPRQRVWRGRPPRLVPGRTPPQRLLQGGELWGRERCGDLDSDPPGRRPAREALAPEEV